MLKEKNRYNYYCPNKKAEEFIKLVGDGKTFCSLFVGGNGTGKSSVGVNIIANICFPKQEFKPIICKKGEEFNVDFHNWREEYGEPPKSWFDQPIFENFPYIKHIRIVSDAETIKSKTIPEIKKWFPKNEYKLLPEAEYITSKQGKPYESRITTNTGFTITLMTYDQDTTQFEAVECGLVWFDEPPPSRIWSANVSRTRMGGMIMMTFTPLFHSGWIKDEVIDKAPSPTYDYVEADAEDNCVQDGIRGVVQHEAIEKMSMAYPEDEREARIHGKFGHLLGLVFKNFNRKIHVIKPFPINPDDFMVIMGLDTHPREADRATWIAIDHNGICYVIAEAAIKGTTAKLAETIKAIEAPTKNNNWRIQERVIEPASGIADQHSDFEDRPLHERLEEDHELYFEIGSKKRDLARRLIQDGLDYFFEGDEMTTKPTLYIFDHCKEVIYEFENYVWDEWKGRNADEKDKKATPKDKNDHQLENIGRILIHKSTFVETEPKETKYQKQAKEMVEEYNAKENKESTEEEDESSFI